MSTIQQVISESLSSSGLGHYQTQARPVIEALQERENRIVESLMDFATGRGLSEREARQALVRAGLIQEPAPQANGQANGQDVAGTLASIQRTLESLTRFARANGYRG